jgi:hypothetical protein
MKVVQLRDWHPPPAIGGPQEFTGEDRDQPKG